MNLVDSERSGTINIISHIRPRHLGLREAISREAESADISAPINRIGEYFS